MKAKGKVGFGFSVHVIEKIGPVVDRERTGLLEVLQLGAFKKRVWPGERAGEKSQKKHRSRAHNAAEIIA